MQETPSDLCFVHADSYFVKRKTKGRHFPAECVFKTTRADG